MGNQKSLAERRSRVRRGVRKKVSGTGVRPRLSVYRSNRHVYAQLIDDTTGRTLSAASSAEQDVKADTPIARGHEVGKLLAERAKKAGIDTAVFDRNGYKYHGRVRAVAEGAREGGLQL